MNKINMSFEVELMLIETQSRNDLRSRAAFWFIFFCDKLHGSYYTSLYLAGVLRRNYLVSFCNVLY